jgi:hypothetical protein
MHYKYLLLLMFKEILAGQCTVRMIPVNNICGRNFDLLNDTARCVTDIEDSEVYLSDFIPSCLPTCVEFCSQGLKEYE